MKRFEIIDILKGYSIFTIMIFHYLMFLKLPTPFDKVIYFGGTGVHLFVLLSGLGLYYSHLNKKLNYKDFIKKRFLKIYIPYIIIVLISAFISIFIPVYNNSLYALGGHIFLYKMFDEQIIGSYGYQLWFISMILQFYFTFPLIIWLKEKFTDKWFLLIGLAISVSWALLVYLTGHEKERIWNSFFLQYFWEFALGMVIATKLFNKQKLLETSPNNLILLAIAIVNCMLYAFLALKGGTTGKLFNDYFALTGYSLFAIFIFNLNIKPINQFFLYVGNISLSVFLIHYLVLLTIANTIQVPALVQVIIALALVFPLASLYQKCITLFFKAAKL
jgi:peptidoglycan/LPS O-acetylase OafA/YrhL